MEVILLQETFAFIRKISICNDVSLDVSGRGVSSKSPKWRRHNNLSVAYCALPAHHPELNFPRSQNPYFFSSLTEGDT